MLKSKHIPIRRCVACGQRKNKEVFLRIVRTSKKNEKKKNIVIDDTSNIDGRGYYLCKSIECVNMAKKKKCLERIFKSKVDVQMYEKIKEAVLRYIEK